MGFIILMGIHRLGESHSLIINNNSYIMHFSSLKVFFILYIWVFLRVFYYIIVFYVYFMCDILGRVNIMGLNLCLNYKL